MPPPPSASRLGTGQATKITGGVNLGILVPAVLLVVGMVVASILVMLPLRRQHGILGFVARYIPGCARLRPLPRSTNPPMAHIPSSSSATDNAGILTTTTTPNSIGKSSHAGWDKESEGLVDIDPNPATPQWRGVRVLGSGSRPVKTAKTLDRHGWGRDTLQVHHQHFHQQKHNRPLRIHPVPSAPSTYPSFETDPDPHGGVPLLSLHSPVHSPATSPGLKPPSRLRFEYFSDDDVDTDGDGGKGVKIQQERGKKRIETLGMEMGRENDVERMETPESWVTPWVRVAEGGRGVRK
ncbi:hypothetical protein EX30DRAFT_398786 [Ascodesmis nigricans]|uniref:Uncharacterized protein n=1 Tax=Ascodesmis nigricans TaxID=341454 RepID=A0A4S2MPA0_9PEZI|nr:hypothetical protein EX30DRAFT_398786 [Ascodesmis nigricans]